MDDYSKRLDHGSSHPTKPLRALARTPTARDDTVYSLEDLFRGNLFTISPFHLSTSKTPFHLQRSCHPRSISFSPPHHDITTPRSPVWIPLSFAATGFGGIILRYVVAKLRMTPGRPRSDKGMQRGAMAGEGGSWGGEKRA